MLSEVVRRGGVVSAAQLDALGWGQRERRRAVVDGRLLQVRRGWFARADADPVVVAAVRTHGCVSCADALRLYGAWVPSALRGDHVRQARRADARPAGCRPYGASRPIHAAIDDIPTAFASLLRCASGEDIVVVADSLLHLGRATTSDLEAWAADAPRRVRRLLERVDVAESGLESMARLRLRRLGIRVRAQVRIGRYRVDLLVGDRLVLECDGAAHHADWIAQAADRARDRALVMRGYVVIRLTYQQIVEGWDEVEQDLLEYVRRDAHRSRGDVR